MTFDFAAVEQAREILSRHLPATRLVAAASLARQSGGEVYLKLESELPTGSFKPRGALYALERNLQRSKVTAVVTSSTGNHGAAVAYAGRALGVPAMIFLPANPNPVKRARIAELGAQIEEGGRDLSEALDRAAACARQRGAYFMEDGRDSDMPVGAATMACEIFEQLPGADVVFIPIGDTTLIRGVAAAAKHLQPGVRIVGVQAAQAPAYYLSWKHGRAVSTETCDTVADGLATRRPLEENVRAIRELVDDIRLVSEEEMLRALRHLLLAEHVVAEPAGAAATAAFLQDAGAHAGQKVVLLVTGANLPEGVLRQALL